MTLLQYTPAQWTLFFFACSFLGWVWESSFVSLLEHRWVNRGFVWGPVLPIYGFGAVVILLFTLSAAHRPPLVFLLGMAGASALEFFTGALLNNLLHLRYWDYSAYRWNLGGYICLTASLCWGVFSLALVYLIHPVVDRLLRRVSPAAAVPIALLLTALLAVDFIAALHKVTPASTG